MPLPANYLVFRPCRSGCVPARSSSLVDFPVTCLFDITEWGHREWCLLGVLHTTLFPVRTFKTHLEVNSPL
ncbi:hypothetical protein MVEN_00976700 [Mycena venus]|uniref:Uncharacterized protein n=1 Tax=Mycena venus TaxID=2733690 RepID=A0A8H6YB07_9AGAR|nr:hypothetical protein MVEN_00976700 [Mycena venus]